MLLNDYKCCKTCYRYHFTYPIKHQTRAWPLRVHHKAIAALKHVQTSFVEGSYVAIVTLSTLQVQAGKLRGRSTCWKSVIGKWTDILT